MITISTLLILMGETYFIGYRRVKDPKKRPLGQFMVKRVSTLYLVAILVTLYLVYIFGINNQELVGNDPLSIIKICFLISMPCAIGAAIPSLLKKY